MSGNKIDYKKVNMELVNAILVTIRKDEKLKAIFESKVQKYLISDLLPIIINTLQNGIAWRKSVNYDKKFSYSTVYYCYRKLIRHGVLIKTYKDLLNRYLEVDADKKMSVLITDTTFVRNKYGSENISYNGHKKGKGTKISLITDKMGVTVSAKIANGSQNDGKILEEQLEEPLLTNYKMKSNREYYLLADSAYDSKAIRNKLIEKGYKPIIAYNKRNSKNPKTHTVREAEKYKLRIRIERINASIKTNRRVNVRYDRYTKIFEGSLYSALLTHLVRVLLKSE